MRGRVAFGLALGASVASAFVACGAPSSFEHLVGGPEASTTIDVAVGPPVGDPTLKPPRQVAPLSASYVDSLRPHFRWELVVADTTGASIDVCDKRDCSGVKKTYTANGTEFTPPEDLAPGRWFWRISSLTAGTVGTVPSMPWSVLVRGGPGVGDARGTILDLNGDGIADLVTTSITPPDPSSQFTGNAMQAILGNDANDPTSFTLDLNDYFASFIDTYVPTATFATTDTNGDGLSDVLFAGLSGTGASATPDAQVILGSSAAADMGLDTNVIPFLTLPPLDTQPAICGGGDLDGDGYGDVILSQRTYAFAMYGGSDGLSVTTFFDNIDPNPPPDAGELPPPTNPLAIFGVDQTGDGINDAIESSSYEYTPLYILAGAHDRTLTDTAITITNTPNVDRALGFAAGDIDADGKPDIVFTTTLATKPSVCVLLGKIVPENGTVTCWTPDAPGTGFGAAIVAADLDADGKDEFLVGTATGGVDILTMPAAALVAEHLTLDYGAALTVLFPGRPGPAVWAAARQNGASIEVYRGKDPVRTIPPPEGASAFGVAIR